MITIEIDNRNVQDALGQLAGRIDNLAPALSEIGERLAETTQSRFNTSTGPDGQKWKPNAAATILGYLGGKAGVYGKTGKITKKGMGYAQNKKTLVSSGLLQDSIRWQLIPGGVAIGTDRFADAWDAGAAVHQFGSLNGKIPARPFLGVSADDEREILDIVARYLADF